MEIMIYPFNLNDKSLGAYGNYYKEDERTNKQIIEHREINKQVNNDQ